MREKVHRWWLLQSQGKGKVTSYVGTQKSKAEVLACSRETNQVPPTSDVGEETQTGIRE